MTFRSFLLAADALRMEGGFHVETPVGTSPVPSPADNKQRNSESMQALQSMMAGVQKGKR